MLRIVFFVIISISAVARAELVVNNRFIVFESRNEFEAYVDKANPGGQLLPYSDPRYVRAERVLRRVWAGYSRLYPATTNGLPIPWIAIQKHNFIDANVTSDSKNPKLAPHAFYMGQRLMELSDDGLAGVMAHELTHLLFPNFRPIYYKVPDGSEPFGFLQSNDPDAEVIYKQWQSLTHLVGPMEIPELNGLPVPYVYDGQLFEVVRRLASQLGDSTSLSCKAVQTPFPKWRLDLVLKYVSMIDQKLRMNHAESEDLKQLTKEYVANLRSCLGSKQARFLEVFQEVLQKPAAELGAKYDDFAKAFDQQPNVVDGMLAATNLGFRKLGDLRGRFDMDNLRVYSDEEYCDDNSVRVLREVGFRPDGIEEFFLSAAEDAQPGSKAQCLALIEDAQVPPYGLLTDTHHAACYRVYHVRALSRLLGSAVRARRP